MLRQNILMAYAYDFVSYLFSEKYLEEHKIIDVLLYGSVARSEANEKSDIDIFINVLKPNRKLEERIEHTISGFYDSDWCKKWKRMGIENKISVLMGELNKLTDLRASIISDGISLFAKYNPRTGGNLSALFVLEPIRPDSKRISITRKLYGFTRYQKHYNGLVHEYKGEKIAGSCFSIPMEFSKEIIKFLRVEKIGFRIKEISVI